MEQDKHLKEILLNASEIASPDFTDAIMKRVNLLSTATSYYKPLISSKMRKAFVFTFIAIVSSILLLCLLIGSANIPLISWLKILPLPVYTYYEVLAFIFIFWIVFTVNALLRKNKLKLN